MRRKGKERKRLLLISHRPTGSEENKKAKVKDTLEVSSAIQSDSIDQINMNVLTTSFHLLGSWKFTLYQ
jgi:hypothetical protein